MAQERALGTLPQPRPRTITLERPWAWLAVGWEDMRQAPTVSLTYGALFAAISLALTAGLFLLELSYLLLPLGAGFMLIGPMLAVGLYETSRRISAGEPVSLRDALMVSTRSPGQLAFLGVLLMLILLAWMRLATLLFAVFFGTLDFSPLPETLNLLFFTWEGLGLLIVGSVVGAALAAIVFAISVVSVALLMEHDVDAITAIGLSLRAVRQNFAVLALWAWLIVILIVAGLVPAYLGLIVTFPLVGHASWHAYRDLVEV